ncbi:MAG: CRISPR-associated endonuclease Cas2 [Bacteroidetes bacterium]|nr:CRISPR-associated endonuclease Cas2 [Bacteroidota bacterium]
MAKKKKPPPTFPEIIRRIRKAGISSVDALNTERPKVDELAPINERIQTVLNIFQTANTDPRYMIFFIMYDIENDKIRNQIAKYLINKGCTRVQKSVFVAQKERKLYEEIHTTLKEVQEMYDNNDSIFCLPVSTDELKAMKIIGQNISFDMILDNKSTMFF